MPRLAVNSKPLACPVLWALLTCAMALPAASQTDAMAMPCQVAAQRAASRTGVPEKVLIALTLAETGRNMGGTLQPWPWSMNVGGQSRVFDTADDLLRGAESVLAQGKTNVDLGCFQLNYRWHGAEFASLDQMIDPAANALYAARFLAKLYAETGDWATAAAAYHSRTPAFAGRYRARFETIFAKLPGTGSLQSRAADSGFAMATTDALIPRINRFPLLQAGARGSAGSLVPRGEAGPRLIGS